MESRQYNTRSFFQRAVCATAVIALFGAPSPRDARGAPPAFLRYTVTGETEGALLGYSFDRLDDINGDGAPDFVVGVPEDMLGPDKTGKVLLVSGKDGSTIRSWRAMVAQTKFYGRNVAAAGDIDGDGIEDVMAFGVSFMEQRSGRTGEIIGFLRDFTWYTPTFRVRKLPDLDGDGVPDFVVGEHAGRAGSDKGRVTVYTAGPRDPLWSHEAEKDETGFGEEVCVLDDLDGDGWPEIAVGESGAARDPPIRGAVYIFGARHGNLLKELRSPVKGDGFGSALAQVGDLDGDGTRELAIGMGSYAVRGLPQAGRVDVVSLRTGEVFWSRTGQNGDRWSVGGGYRGDEFGTHAENVGDMDGDGLDDLAVWSPRTNVGFAYDFGSVSLCSGADGSLLALYEREDDSSRFGAGISRLGDIDGDGRPEFLVGAMTYYGFHMFGEEGRVYVFSYVPEGPRYVRGDADADGDLDVTDAVTVLRHLFHGGDAPCEEAMDYDRNAVVSVTDAIATLNFLVRGGVAPPGPFPGCGRLHSLRGELPCKHSACGD